ncbi:ATP-binding protein [Maribacter sp. 2307UL18-2]|uniref:ATP-binding protein n=1 Tax=Maribacter sp. 2307UL18-2 TaxID=3386274 RepID=UPI0039BCA66D
MILKRIYTSSKTYVALLILAIALLLFTAIMGNRQINLMETSAEIVEQTHQVKDGISQLFSHYFRLESPAFRNSLSQDSLSASPLDSFIAEGNRAWARLDTLTSKSASQQERLQRIEILQETLYTKLTSEKFSSNTSLTTGISEILFNIRAISEEMRNEENRLMQERKAIYTTRKTLAPILLLVLGAFALLVFGLSFLRIYKNKKRIQVSEAFLESVVQTTDNIINYYEPVYDSGRNICDFKIVFANKGNKDHLGLEPDEIIGKYISQVFPFLKLNGEFQEMVNCFINKKKINFDRQVSIDGRRMWFKSVITPHAKGLLVTARNATVEEQAKAEQSALKEQALEDNAKLQETESFLKNVLANTDNVISYFTPVYNKEKELSDFLMVFNNENIENVLQKDLNELENKLMSEVLPMHFENGVFDELKTCFQKNEKVRFEKEYEFEGSKFWFKTTAVKLNNGVLTTSTDTTLDKRSGFQLEKQNLQLLDNRAFLSNIFKSISHVVMHFTSIRNKDGKIIDFKIEFINEQISAVTGDIPAEVKHKKASEVYPSIFKTGVFEHLVAAVESGKPVEYEVPYKGNATTQWFRATAIKLGDGVTVTTRDITVEKEKSNRLTLLNEELKTQNSILTEAENVAKIGSYLWFLDTNEAQLSDNFFRILGEEPNSFDVTIEKVRNFVHPDDLELYDRIVSETTEKGKTEVDTYRIITKKGVAKYIYVKGQNLERDGRPVSVGVVQDITEQIEKTEHLRKRNVDLKRSNAELEAFNRVASHDLQEPLRKIQLFISRITESPTEKFPKRTLEYFNKIEQAANRMQSLIVNLLAYSRIDGSHEDFEKIDLMQVLEEVVDNLSSRIEETQAEIKAEKLPIVLGVSYQLEQLFSNLISNAIKYRATDVKPIITIQSEKVRQKEIADDFFKTANYYQKISLSDNGIGFSDEHAEKIFEVFQRLHGKGEYSGTGIGLAICKKIVENHHGHIYAFGKVGKGSTFVFYLPV